jgi:hypothetical protein
MTQARHAPDAVLCSAASQQVCVTLTSDGAQITFAALAVFEGADGVKYVLGFEPAERPGNRPPALDALPLSEIANPVTTQTPFTVHPRHKPILLALQSARCMVVLA